jgi:hypothetical protein
METYGGVEVWLTYKYSHYNVTTLITKQNRPKLTGKSSLHPFGDCFMTISATSLASNIWMTDDLEGSGPGTALAFAWRD